MKLENICIDVLENINLGLILCRLDVKIDGQKDYQIEDVNQAFLMMTGQTKDMLIHAYGSDVFALDQQYPQLLSQLNQMIDDNRPFQHDWYVDVHDLWYRLYVTSPSEGYVLVTCQEITSDINSLKACETQLAIEEKHKARYKSLIKIMRRKYTSIEHLLNEALDEAIQLTDSEIGYIYYYDNNNKEFVFSNWSDSVTQCCRIQDKKNVYHLSETGLWGEAVRQRKPVLVNNLSKPTIKNDLPDPHKSVSTFLSIPVFDGDTIEAVIGVANKKNGYDQFDIYQLTLLMNNVWNVAKDLKAQARLAYISYHDQLTGLYNRYYFETELARLDHSRHLPIAVIIGDVNGLKLTNDVFGHLEGDNVLKSVSQSIKNVCRDEDIVARWGGDEFILLLPQTNAEAAKKLCKRITDKVHAIDHLVINPSISLGYSIKILSTDSLQHHLKKAEDHMYQMKLHESKNQRNRIIDSMRQSLYEKSYETEKHAKRLVHYSQAIASEMGLGQEQISELKLFAYLHDIGKIGIPDNVLKKPDSLNEDEWAIMRKHPEIGYRIAIATPELSPISEYILYHHERYDGTGYPKGLKKNAIPLPSRIIAVVDAFDAMTSNRPYSQPISTANALREIHACGGSQFDPKIVQIFLNLIQEQKSTFIGELSPVL